MKKGEGRSNVNSLPDVAQVFGEHPLCAQTATACRCAERTRALASSSSCASLVSGGESGESSSQGGIGSEPVPIGGLPIAGGIGDHLPPGTRLRQGLEWGVNTRTETNSLNSYAFGIHHQKSSHACLKWKVIREGLVGIKKAGPVSATALTAIPHLATRGTGGARVAVLPHERVDMRHKSTRSLFWRSPSKIG